MEKTLREWFEMFPEPYRTQAIENTVALSGEKRLKETEQSAADAIECAFMWDETNEETEGEDYWYSFYLQLDRGEIDLTKPSEGGKQ